jgi:hypothetical protein
VPRVLDGGVMTTPTHVVQKKEAVIVDIDGTLALRTGDRSPFDWERVGEDVPNQPIIGLTWILTRTGKYWIILVSGRDEVCRPETEAWLKDKGVTFDRLYMRPKGNYEKDSVIKERLYLEFIAPEFQVDFVLDDRDQVVRMWRSLGLTTLQVAEGDF